MSQEEDDEPLILRPAEHMVQLVASQLHPLYAGLSSLLSLASDSVHRADDAKDHTQQTLRTTPARAAQAGATLLRRLGEVLAGALYACMVLVAVLAVAAAVGVGLVRFWAEEPVLVREPLRFDYTEVNPSATVFLGTPLARRARAVPVGHTLDVSILLVMPESDYNLHIGIFQISAEVISSSGKILAKSSQPCMLRFKSLPVRLTRAFILGIPLLLGITHETQTITVSLLKYKEGYPKTEAIRVRLHPRAGTMYLPELYEAETIVKSQLPWRKNIVHRWKWTFYVWTTLYVYIMLLIVLVCWFRPLLFPLGFHGGRRPAREPQPVQVVEWQYREEEEPDVTDESAILRRWRRRRGKRKAALLGEAEVDVAESSASGFTTEGAAIEGEDVEEDTVEWAPLEPEGETSNLWRRQV